MVADRIRVQIEQMEALRGQMLSLSSALQDIRSELRGVDLDRISGSEVRVSLSESAFRCVERTMRDGKTEKCLDSIERVLNDMGRYTHAVAGSIGMAADAFAETEQKLVWRFGAMMQSESSMFQEICRILGFEPDRSKWELENHEKFNELIKSGQLIVEDGMAMLVNNGVYYLLDEKGLLASYEKKVGLSGVKETGRIYNGTGMREGTFQGGFDTMGAKLKKDIKKQKSNEDENPTKFYDKKGNPIEGEKKELGQKMEMLSVGVSGGLSASLLYEETKFQNGNLKGEASVGVGNAEFTGSIMGGFGVYLPGENGEKELYAGIDAKVGASVSALETEGSLEYELIDGISVGVESDVAILKASAEASASVGIIAGEFVMHAKAGAEANLVEANVAGNLDVGGIKGTVGAGVQIGVGASAEAGYKDGVISFDASLSLGVGVSVNFELDVSGLVDNVGNAVQSLADGLSSICGWWR